MATVSGLNGTPMNGASPNCASMNGSRWEHPSAGPPTDLEAEPVWSPTMGTWPGAEPDEFEVERQRLEAEIAAAKARTAEARRRAADRDTELRAELIASQELVAEVERQHEMAVARVREAAQAEVKRVLTEARRRVAGDPARETAQGPSEVDDAE